MFGTRALVDPKTAGGPRPLSVKGERKAGSSSTWLYSTVLVLQNEAQSTVIPVADMFENVVEDAATHPHSGVVLRQAMAEKIQKSIPIFFLIRPFPVSSIRRIAEMSMSCS